MNATTVAVDVAKNVFERAIADAQWRVVGSAQLTRAQYERWFDNRKVELVIMEACGSAHYWARTLPARGIEVRLLPAQYVRVYVKRNKTDAADARALLEATRGGDIKPVRVKTIEQQALQAGTAELHSCLVTSSARPTWSRRAVPGAGSADRHSRCNRFGRARPRSTAPAA